MKELHNIGSTGKAENSFFAQNYPVTAVEIAIMDRFYTSNHGNC
jgi:hypothetical protein